MADISDKGSLPSTFATSAIVLNCTGPYRFLGDAVVEACLTARTHYMDICGEPQFMESCFLKYNKLATDFGVLIIHACAFDSVPADLGVLFTSRQVHNSVFCRLEIIYFFHMFVCLHFCSSCLNVAHRLRAFCQSLLLMVLQVSPRCVVISYHSSRLVNKE